MMITRRLSNFFLNISNRKHSIAHILQHKNINKETINVKGWVQTHRVLKGTTFLGVNDGSCLDNLQIVVGTDCLQLPIAASYGTSIHVTGVLQESLGAGQEIDLKADRVEVIGKCRQNDYPFKYKKQHTAEYLRQHLHLRSKTKTFGSLLRIRNKLTHAIHRTLQEDGYIEVNTPILTSNDCEGAGEVFKVEPADPEILSNMENQEGVGIKEHFFGCPVYLTVSGQLHLEALASGFTKVYTLGPTFRAENSRGRHHLSEFYMLEAELSFIDDLECLHQSIESTVCNSLEFLLGHVEEDIMWYWKKTDDVQRQKEIAYKLAASSFKRMTYTEAIDVLNQSTEQFKFKPKWGCDLQKEHEHHLVKYCGDTPVFITDYPSDIKPFYMRQNKDDKTVAAVDLLVPGVGELCGGSLRETNVDLLSTKIQQMGDKHSLDWYLDLRNFGSVPHGGYGLGIERLLMAITGISNIRDVIPFPRSTNNCKL